MRGIKRIMKNCVPVIALLCTLLTAGTAKAETYHTVTVLDTNDVPRTTMRIADGSTVYMYLKDHPECLDEITLNRDYYMPVFYTYDNGLKPYNTGSKVKSDLTLYFDYVEAITKIPLKLIWPKAGESAGIPNLSPAGNNPRYIVSSYRWLADPHASTPYTGLFEENKRYYLEMYIYASEGYGLYVYADRLTVTVNGDKADYVRETYPSECIHVIYTVKTDDKVQAYVRRLYNMCLFREPDPSGFKSWSGKLKNKTATAAEAAYGFFNSSEFKNRDFDDADFVEICYEVLMGRASDAGGKKQWLEKLENGVSRNYVLKGFFGSKEFHTLCSNYGITAGTIKLTEARDQNYGITSFVARCYTKALERKFDAGGLNTWCKKILAAANKKQAAIDTASNGFFHSAEFVNKNHTNEKYVTILYRTFLGREPDTGGFTNWVNKLKNGTSRDAVLMGFANSAEFAKIMADYGIK